MTPATAHVVDDDAAIRDALAWLLASRGVRAQVWASGPEFLAELGERDPGCVILDVRMDGMSGMEVFELMLRRGSRMPAIFLTGHGDVPLAVEALKKGAFDFVEKPFNDNLLVDRVLEAIRFDATLRQQRQAEETVAARLANLTPREHEVMRRVLAGDPNKAIADALDIAVRTVEVHRARVFEKMGVSSAVELAQLVRVDRPVSG